MPRATSPPLTPELLSVETERYGLFNLGNIRDLSLIEATKSDVFQTLLKDMNSGMARCKQECDYYGFCGGGTGSNKYWEHGSLDASETCACRFSSQIPVDVPPGKAGNRSWGLNLSRAAAITPGRRISAGSAIP